MKPKAITKSPDKIVSPLPPPGAEWLEADGLGGFASGTVSGIRTRRYHALLLTATNPPGGRMVLVNGFDAWLETPDGVIHLTRQRYARNTVAPTPMAEVAAFDSQPWPRWRLQAEGGYEIIFEIFAEHGASAVYLRWTFTKMSEGDCILCVRPFLSGRDFHSLHHENGAFRFEPEQSGDVLTWRPYEGVPGTVVRSNGSYRHEPHWYRQFMYFEERARGMDHTEDLAAPGVLEFHVSDKNPAELAFAATGHEAVLGDSFEKVSRRERKRREAFQSNLHRAADAYLVKRGEGKSVIAGYPWFGDWGRDTFISMRGLCLATNRLEETRSILLQWAGAVSNGLLPNRFADDGDSLEYHSVDAALWFVITVHEFFMTRGKVAAKDGKKLRAAVESVLGSYMKGTLYDIRMDTDGLLACGVPGTQLTWMDAKVNGHVVTPRIGKPVEVQALWLNALDIGASFSGRWAACRDKGIESFRAKFWNADAGSLFDVIDVDHQSGANDASIRPNQVFAIGGLPVSLIEGPRAKQALETIERQLLTPGGLRTLAPGSPGYVGKYEGDVHQRDHAYHQGTVWPWLAGPFVQAWLKVHGDTKARRQEARKRFLEPLRQHYEKAGLGHIAEIADADEPHTPRGAPFQAWSLGEVIRLESLLAK